MDDYTLDVRTDYNWIYISASKKCQSNIIVKKDCKDVLIILKLKEVNEILEIIL